MDRDIDLNIEIGVLLRKRTRVHPARDPRGPRLRLRVRCGYGSLRGGIGLVERVHNYRRPVAAWQHEIVVIDLPGCLIKMFSKLLLCEERRVLSPVAVVHCKQLTVAVDGVLVVIASTLY